MRKLIPALLTAATLFGAPLYAQKGSVREVTENIPCNTIKEGYPLVDCINNYVKSQTAKMPEFNIPATAERDPVLEQQAEGKKRKILEKLTAEATFTRNVLRIEGTVFDEATTANGYAFSLEVGDQLVLLHYDKQCPDVAAIIKPGAQVVIDIRDEVVHDHYGRSTEMKPYAKEQLAKNGRLHLVGYDWRQNTYRCIYPKQVNALRVGPE